MKKTLLIIAAIAALAGCKGAPEVSGVDADGRWTEEKALAWHEQQGWRSGCDFIPSTAINQIEMWQESTFDKATIEKELGWAKELGFTTMRVYLSSVVWKNEAESFKKQMDTFLSICDADGIKPVFVFFDDCWNPESEIGPQPEPKPGVHNSGWVRDPSDSLRADTTALFPVLEAYVKDVLTTFKDDERVLWWDLYNEPGNSGYHLASMPLLKNVFKWAHEVRPSQPVSAGIWYGNAELNAFQLDNSDITSYHNYNPVDDHQAQIDSLKNWNRPMYCTEYMARRNNSLFKTVMPMLKENGVSAINWGFVSGKTNTIFAWDTPIPSGEEPELWFHDIYRQDKTPFDPEEIAVIKQVNGVE